MSLRGLMWHKFTIQSSVNQARTEHGGINRRDGWPIIFSNIPCNIQGISKEDVTTEFRIQESKNLFVFFYIRKDIILDETMRIITAKKFKEKIDTNLVTEENAELFRIFSYKGIRNQVTKRNTILTEVFMEETNRWEVT